MSRPNSFKKSDMHEILGSISSIAEKKNKIKKPRETPKNLEEAIMDSNFFYYLVAESLNLSKLLFSQEKQRNYNPTLKGYCKCSREKCLYMDDSVTMC